MACSKWVLEECSLKSLSTMVWAENGEASKRECRRPETVTAIDDCLLEAVASGGRASGGEAECSWNGGSEKEPGSHPPVSCESLPLAKANVRPSERAREPTDTTHLGQLPRVGAGWGHEVLGLQRRSSLLLCGIL